MKYSEVKSFTNANHFTIDDKRDESIKSEMISSDKTEIYHFNNSESKMVSFRLYRSTAKQSDEIEKTVLLAENEINKNFDFLNNFYNLDQKGFKSNKSRKNFLFGQSNIKSERNPTNISISTKINNEKLSFQNRIQIFKIDENSSKYNPTLSTQKLNTFRGGSKKIFRTINTNLKDFFISSKNVTNEINTIERKNDKFDQDINLSCKKKKKFKILIVDDHKFVRESLRNIILHVLKKFNLTEDYKVKEAQDGVDILKLVIKDQFKGNRIKCVITDENMEFINGSKAARIIKNLENNNKIKPIHIASITTYHDEVMVKHFSQIGICYFLPKPCNEKSLNSFFDKYKILI